jgi:hypothetical protein
MMPLVGSYASPASEPLVPVGPTVEKAPKNVSMAMSVVAPALLQAMP